MKPEVLKVSSKEIPGNYGVSLIPISASEEVIEKYTRWWFPHPHPDLLPGIGLHPQTPFIREDGQIKRVGVRDWVANEQASPNSCCWVGTLSGSGEVIGHISAHDIEFPKCNIVYMVGPEYQNQGLGTSLVKSALKILNEYGFSQINARVHLKNPKSARVLVKNGFRLISEDQECHHFQLVP